MTRIGLAAATCVSLLLLASWSCSSFDGEPETDGGTSASEAGGADGGSGGDGSGSEGGPEEDAGKDAGPVVVKICATGACRVVFVTSEKFNGNFVGVAGADTACNTAAQKNPTLATRDFKAWLSEQGKSASSRIVHEPALRYERLDGRIVANDWNDLVDGNLAKPDQHRSVRHCGHGRRVDGHGYRGRPDGEHLCGLAGRLRRRRRDRPDRSYASERRGLDRRQSGEAVR